MVVRWTQRSGPLRTTRGPKGEAAAQKAQQRGTKKGGKGSSPCGNKAVADGAAAEEPDTDTSNTPAQLRGLISGLEPEGGGAAHAP